MTCTKHEPTRVIQKKIMSVYEM
eukprot:SAG11_NODE_40397_length_202_cov_45.553398_1_plen_22_part_10